MASADNPPAERIVRWNTTTKVVVVVVLLILLAIALTTFRVLYVPLIIGALLAYILSPLVQQLHRRLRLPRGLATLLIYLILLAIVIPLPVSLVPWGVNQVSFLRHEAVNFVAYFESVSANTISVMGFQIVIGDIVREVGTQLTDALTSIAPQSISLFFGAAETALLVIFTFLIAFYFTRDGPKIVQWGKGLVPPDYREDASRLAHEIEGIFSAFLRGQVILALVVAVILTIVSSILGLTQPVLMGVLGGFMEFLPSVGHAIWLIIAGILALVEGSSTLPVSNLVFLLIVIGVHALYTQFDLNILIPRIIGQQVHLHPMVVIIGIIVGAKVGGVLGVALAAPSIAALRVIGRYVYARLFDLDPFPMVGPPGASREERLREAAQATAEVHQTGRLKDVVEAVRERAVRSRATQDEQPPEIRSD